MITRPWIALFALGLSTVAAPAQRKITSPKEAFGKQVGADHFLANYTQLSSYWKTVARESDRMVLEEIGTTSYGQPMWMAIISMPSGLAGHTRSTTLSRMLRVSSSSLTFIR